MSRLGQFTLVPMGIRAIIWARIAAAFKLLWQRPGVRWRVALLSLLIPLLCANGAFIWQDYHLRHQAIVAEHNQKSMQIDYQMDSFVRAIEEATYGFAARWVDKHRATPANPDILDSQVSDLTEFVEARPEFSQGFITDATGAIRVSSDPAFIGDRLGPQDLYQQAYDIRKFIVSNAIAPAGGEDPFVLFIQPLMWNTSSPEGFLVLQTKLMTISGALYLSTQSLPDAKATIFDSQGRILARSDYQTFPGIVLGDDMSDNPLWKQVMSHPAKEQYGPGLYGVDRVIFPTNPEFTPWITTVSYDQAELFDPLGYRLWVLIGALAVSVGAATWIGEVWVRRERRMVTALEERVEERTTELSETNNTLRNEIAERVKAEGALRKSEAQQKALVTAIPDLILQVSKDGVIQSAKLSNSLPEHWASDVRQGKGIDQLLSPDISQLYLDYIHRALQTGDVQLFEHELHTGSELLSWEARLVVNGEDEVVAIIRDITKQRELEKQFLLSQKMESVGRLAGGIAHEFNNLLAAIIGFSSLALENSASNVKTKDYLQHSLKASERAAGLVQQLLTFARSKSSKPSDFDLNELIIETDNLLRRIIGEDIELVILPSPDLKLIKADRSQIQQVLLNLATNARDAMPEGGKLIIETSNVVLNHSPGMSQAGASPGKYVALTATDTGAGMNDEVKAHIFEPFFTTKEVGQGTGLGLSICYGIVTQNGGYVEVESALKEGSRFKIYLPQADAKEPVNPPENILESGGLWGAETVLLVEDEPVVLNLISHVLRQQGYTVLEAANGVDALSIAREHIVGGGQIHLAIADVVMPQMGGKELVERLMEMSPGIKALFMSGYIQGVASYIDILGSEVELIQKPFTPNALLSKVREALAGAKHSSPHVYS